MGDELDHEKYINSAVVYIRKHLVLTEGTPDPLSVTGRCRHPLAVVGVVIIMNHKLDIPYLCTIPKCDIKIIK